MMMLATHPRNLQGGPISPGEWIDWERGAGAQHQGSCELQPTAVNVKRPRAAGPTERQLNFLLSLLEERDPGDDVELQHLADPARRERVGLTKALASEYIDRLLARPKKVSAPREPTPDVPAGRYALTGDDGTTDFYKVDRPTEGKWAGFTFVKLLVANGGYGDDMGEQRLRQAQGATILRRILDTGVMESLTRYGHELGACGICGRTLTDNESIERGIGPVCAGRL